MQRQVPQGDGPESARFNQQTVLRTTTDIAKAIGHSNSRNARVVQVACFFSLIRSTSPSLNVARVLIEAAQTQMFQSMEGYQAAHYLPGQLKILTESSSDGVPWNFISAPLPRQRLEYLFADVEHLPAAFNKADSAAESKGLRETFRLLGEGVLRDPASLPKGAANKSLIRRLYDNVWVEGARRAFNAAIAQKMTASEVPELEVDEQGNLNLENLQRRGSADWSRENEASILRRYNETLRTPPPDLGDGQIGAIERLFPR